MKNGKSSEKLSDDWTGHWNFTSVRSVDGLDEVANDCNCSGFAWPSPRRPRDCAVRWDRFSSCRMHDCCLRQPARSSWTDHRRRASNLSDRLWGLLARRSVPAQAGLISRLDASPLRSTLAASARRDLARGFLYTATAKSKSLRHHSSSPGLSSRANRQLPPCGIERIL
jgi:hypothetical protein